MVYYFTANPLLSLLQVNGQDVRTIPAHILHNLLMGPLGSHVEITFRPHSSPQAQVLVLQVRLFYCFFVIISPPFVLTAVPRRKSSSCN